MNLPVRTDQANLQQLLFFVEQTIVADILRLDKIHPVISGNKWFKLRYYLEAAKMEGKKGLLSFGGPYSNHIVAAALAAKDAGLKFKALIRGDSFQKESPAMQEARSYGAAIHYLSRMEYSRLKTCGEPGLATDEWLCVPEGGAGTLGVKGAETILALVPDLSRYSHIICAVGTGTMAAGLSNAAFPHQRVIGISSLKGEDQLSDKIASWQQPESAPVTLVFDYHFGGYARHPENLLTFMNQLYRVTEIPSDIVYTAKLLFAVKDMIQKNYFEKDSRLLVIHSGGLQGNRSLSAGQLIFNSY